MLQFNSKTRLFSFGKNHIIANLETGSIVGLTNEGYRLCIQIKQGNVLDYRDALQSDCSLASFLMENGFFSHGRHQKPVALASYLHVTQRCNLSCKGCYSFLDDRNNVGEMSLAQIRHVIDGLNMLGVKKLIVSGGEPLLRKDIIDVVRYARDSIPDCQIVLLTNGTTDNPEMYHKLAEYITSISVSFDGPNSNSAAYIRGQQRFSQLIKIVGMIKKAGIDVEMTPTIHSKNKNSIAEYLELADQIGVRTHFSILTCSANTELPRSLSFSSDDLAVLAENLFQSIVSRSGEESVVFGLCAKQNCGAGYSVISVNHEGSVFPCHMLNSEKYYMGSLLGDHRSTVAGIKEQMKSYKSVSVEDISFCKSCSYLYLCGGGCRARALHPFGQDATQDAYCELSKAYYKSCSKLLDRICIRKGD